jgi:hypothetical protein
MLAQGLSATRAKGHQLDERVKAPIFDTTKGGVWVNGKPITGVAILDTGAMPLLVGRAGMKQMGWTDEDVIPNAVRLGLADGKSTQLQGLTKRTVKFTLNKWGKGETSIAVRAVVTEAPYDFPIGNIILYSLGGVIDSWGYRGAPEFRFRLEWLAGPKLASRREGRVPLCYMRNPVTTTPEAQYCMRPQQALPAGGEDEQVQGGPEIEAEEFAEMPPLETKSETESKGSEYVDLQPLEYEQYEQERGVRVPSALANQGGEGAQGPVPRVALMVHYCRYLGQVLDSYALMRFEPLAPVLIPPRYEMLRILGPEEEVPDLPFVEQPLRATRNPRVWVISGEPWSTPVNESAEEPNSVSVDSHRWVSLPFGVAESPASVQRRIERGLYVGPVYVSGGGGFHVLLHTGCSPRRGATGSTGGV